MKKLTLLIVTCFLFGQTLLAQTDSEIYLFSIDKNEGKFSLANGKNITNNKGYDNQPSFTLNNKSILFTSNRRDNNFDIYEYVLADGKISAITTSNNGEYTAQEFDQHTVMYVREGKDDQGMSVWKFDRRTKKIEPALNNKEPVAYYAWNSKGDALVWVRYAFMMHWVNPARSINKYVADFAQPSVPHLIPGTNKFSFIERHPDDSLWIKEFDPATESVRPIIGPKDDKKDYCWMPDGTILTGSGSKLFGFKEGVDKNWKELVDLQAVGIKDITRMSVSKDGKRLALVSNQ